MAFSLWPTRFPNCPTRSAETVMCRAALTQANWTCPEAVNRILDDPSVLKLQRTIVFAFNHCQFIPPYFLRLS